MDDERSQNNSSANKEKMRTYEYVGVSAGVVFLIAATIGSTLFILRRREQRLIRKTFAVFNAPTTDQRRSGGWGKSYTASTSDGSRDSNSAASDSAASDSHRIFINKTMEMSDMSSMNSGSSN